MGQLWPNEALLLFASVSRRGCFRPRSMEWCSMSNPSSKALPEIRKLDFLALLTAAFGTTSLLSMLLLLSFVTSALSNPQGIDPLYKEVEEQMRAGKYAEAEQKVRLFVNRKPTANG